MDRIRGVRVKRNDGTYSEQIPFSALSQNIIYNQNYTLIDVLGDIDMQAGSLQEQINKLAGGDDNVAVVGSAVVGTAVIGEKQEEKEATISPLVEITYAELKTLRDTGKLLPGQQYRITDYVCTTTQAESRAVSHPFDIIVTADTENILNENARACLHEGDDYYSAEGSQADLAAWELKYCIDNNTDRFLWADSTNGKGVVYWLKDEHNNECPYDFKQIQFKRYEITACEKAPSLVGFYAANQHSMDITTGEDFVWAYTFSVYDSGSEAGITAVEDMSVFAHPVNGMGECDANVLSENCINFGSTMWIGPGLLNAVFFNTFGKRCYSNTFGNYCCGNTFGSNCYGNTLGAECMYNTFGEDCQSNTFGSGCSSNTLGTDCSYNTFGKGCSSNTFGNYCTSNTFGSDCSSNTLGENCSSNTFGDGYKFNTFGSSCQRNTFGENCTSNTFGINYESNTFGDSCQRNTFGNDCRFNRLGDRCDNNTFVDSCESNTFGNYCRYNTFGVQSATGIYQYYHIMDGTKGTSRNPNVINPVRNRDYETWVGLNSSGTLKTWVPADLVQ